jgi:predicted metalloprotease with PDZ domain
LPAKVKLELVGLNGNAFNLLAHFRQTARHQGWTAEAIQAVIDEATNADYDHLLATLLDHLESPEFASD